MNFDASMLGVVKREDPLDAKKLSALVVAGGTVETIDGRRFRVMSKVVSASGVFFHLSSPAKSLCVTASELAAMEPLPRGIARLAHVLRILSYNRDFTQYVNEAVKAHGLPVDPKMDWSKWLYSQFTTRGKYDEDQLDEALHEYIIDLIYGKDILESFDPKKMKKERNRNQPLARKVSIFLMRMFLTYRSMVERTLSRLQSTVRGESIRSEKGHNLGLRRDLSTPMVKPGEGGVDTNILDTEAYALPPREIEEAESWEDIARFRAAYGIWLKKRKSPQTEEKIMTLLDIVVDTEKGGTGRTPCRTRYEGGMDGGDGSVIPVLPYHCGRAGGNAGSLC